MNIEIKDNVFKQQTIDELYFYYRDYAPWGFYGDGVGGSNWRKFKKEIEMNNKWDKLLYNKSNLLAKEYGGDKVSFRRGYLGAHVYGMVHDFHYDDIAEDYNQILTIMFYLNRDWKIQYSGETVFLTEDWQDIKESIIPKPGRAVVFDGYIPHAAREVSRMCVDLRMVATFKYEFK
jgi:Rps23 Pro-64 3,4-dihydroxylase Tpa1-like proline 4-hydroxylase|tara:strand:- start:477 stop:1004 length:528 start_codon:yes stop_codon:yes gene_type:complete